MRRTVLALFLPILIATGCSSCGSGTAEQKIDRTLPIVEGAAACAMATLGTNHTTEQEVAALFSCAVQAYEAAKAARAAATPDAKPATPSSPSSPPTDAPTASK